MTIAGGYVDDKIVRARKMLAEGRPMREIAEAIGYKDASSCRRYMARMGCTLPSLRGTRHYPSHTDEQRRHLSDKMKEWWAQQGRGRL